MQRSILKIALMCCITFFLAAVPITYLYAAEDAIETNIKIDESVSGIYYVNAQHGLKMRAAPSKDADVVALLPYKTQVTVTGAADNGWYQIKYASQDGYVAANYITKSSAEDADSNTENDTSETVENTYTAEKDTFGITPVITALAAAIIIMTILAIFTAYSFLKKGAENDAEDDDYDEEDDVFDMDSKNREYIPDDIDYDDDEDA